MSTRVIPVNQDWPEPVAQRRLRITDVRIDPEGIHVQYQIAPGIEDLREKTLPRPPFQWEWYARDNLGNAYEQCGGAYGRSPDGQSTRGTLSLRPPPSPEATRLHIYLGLAFQPELNISESFHEFDVDLAASPT